MDAHTNNFQWVSYYNVILFELSKFNKILEFSIPPEDKTKTLPDNS